MASGIPSTLYTLACNTKLTRLHILYIDTSRDPTRTISYPTSIQRVQSCDWQIKIQTLQTQTNAVLIRLLQGRLVTGFTDYNRTDTTNTTTTYKIEKDW